MANTAKVGNPATRSPFTPRAPDAVDRRGGIPATDTRAAPVERRAPAPNAGVSPGLAPKIPRHAVLYMREEPTAEYKPVGSFELGDADEEQQGEYLFEGIRADLINKARARGARIPYFLAQVEEKGIKVQE